MPQLIGTGFFTVTDVNDGAGGLNIVLSNSSHNIPTDSAGANGNYAGAVTTVSIYSGTTDISAQYSVTAAPSSGVTGSLSGKTYTVTAITVDAGYVDLTATSAGFPTLAARFSLVRAKAGAAGTPGTPGANGQRTATITMYRWSAAAPTTYPSGSSTYTWATGVFTAPATPNSWSIIPPAAVAGQTLWGIDALVTDSATTATTAVTWSSTAPYPAGSAGSNGSNGSAGSRGAGMYKIDSATGLWPDGDATANALAASACPGGAVVGDTVTIYKTTDVTVSVTKQYTGSAWSVPALTVHGGMLVTGSITARALAAGSVSADKLNVAAPVNNAGVYTSFKLQPTSNQPLWLGTTDAAGNNPVASFYVDRSGEAYFKGGLAVDTVDADAIKQAAKTQINPYFLGAQAGSKQENTTSASMASLATVTLAAVTVIGGVVNVSATLSGGFGYYGTTLPTVTDPQWKVEIFRTSTAGTMVFNKTFTGGSRLVMDKPDGSGPTYYDATESISINVAFTDSGAPASTVYVMRVTKLGGTQTTALNRSYFGANSPSYVTNTLQKAANGYFKDKETGLIIQWGTVTSMAANAVTTVTLPIAFSSLCTFASANSMENSVAADPAQVYGKTTSTISIVNGAGVVNTVLWLAMGY